MWTLAQCLDPAHAPAARQTEYQKHIAKAMDTDSLTTRWDNLEALATETAQAIFAMDPKNASRVEDLFIGDQHMRVFLAMAHTLPQDWVREWAMTAMAYPGISPHWRKELVDMASNGSESAQRGIFPATRNINRQVCLAMDSGDHDGLIEALAATDNEDLFPVKIMFDPGYLPGQYGPVMTPWSPKDLLLECITPADVNAFAGVMRALLEARTLRQLNHSLQPNNRVGDKRTRTELVGAICAGFLMALTVFDESRWMEFLTAMKDRMNEPLVVWRQAGLLLEEGQKVLSAKGATELLDPGQRQVLDAFLESWQLREALEAAADEAGRVTGNALDPAQPGIVPEAIPVRRVRL